jgi:hypothetical protein
LTIFSVKQLYPDLSASCIILSVGADAPRVGGEVRDVDTQINVTKADWAVMIWDTGLCLPALRLSTQFLILVEQSNGLFQHGYGTIKWHPKNVMNGCGQGPEARPREHSFCRYDNPGPPAHYTWRYEAPQTSVLSAADDTRLGLQLLTHLLAVVLVPGCRTARRIRTSGCRS